MRVIQSPSCGDFKLSYYDKTLFLAGGISNCPDWQDIIINLFDKKVDDEKFTIFNPRRKSGLDFANETESINQILWEHGYLSQAKHILFWFPKETVCPITLFELGKWVEKKEGCRRRDGCSSPVELLVSVGTHPEYIRSLDVKVQVNLICDKIDVKSNLEDLVEDVIKQMNLKKKIIDN